MKSRQALQRHIVWVDDERRLYEEFLKLWPKTQAADFEFRDLQELTGLNADTALERLAQQPPDVLILDWQDGLFEIVYLALRDKVKHLFLASQMPSEYLRASGVYDKFPELASRTLHVPFTSERLLGEIETQEREHSGGSGPDFRALVNDLVAIRFFSETWRATSKTTAWIDDIETSTVSLDEDEQRRLESGGGPITKLWFGADPADDKHFGLMQSTFSSIQGIPEVRFAESVVFVSNELMDPSRGGLSAYGESAGGILDLMRSFGFKRGRYYRVTEVSGMQRDLLELAAVTPLPPNVPALPVTAEMDEDEHRTFQSYSSQYESIQATELLTLLESTGTQNETPNDKQIWAKFVPDCGAEKRLVVPVFVKSRSALENGQTAKLRGVFAFDLGRSGDISPRLRQAVEAPLLRALGYFRKARAAEASALRRRRAERLQMLHAALASGISQFEIERELTNRALSIAFLHETNENSATNRHVRETHSRSAMFARYDPLRRSLEVTADTDNFMLGYGFAVEDSSRFVMVRAAVNALRALEQHTPPTPLFVPDIKGDQARDPALTISLQDWSTVQGCSIADQARSQKWLEEQVCTVVACPLTAGEQLFGVLVVRSAVAREFDRFRVEGLQQCADAAVPYLAKLEAESHQKDWIGLVMHEMRSHLSMAVSELDVQLNPPMQIASPQFEQLERILKSGHGLSDLFLRQTQGAKHDDGPATSEGFWKDLDKYGELCARGSRKGLGWRLTKPEDIPSQPASRLLERVLRVLIDNAYRHAPHDQSHGQAVMVRVETDPASSSVLIEISNPGQFKDLQSIDLIRKSDERRVGLTLSNLTCRSVGATLQLRNIPPDSECEVSRAVATVRWPVIGAT